MTPEQWRQVKDVLASALEREPEQRPQFVAEACGDNAELRGAVESLIRADACALIPPDPKASSAPPQRPRLKSGARLGRYEVCSLLAAGGMGEVYRARDTRLGREVALKMLPDMFAADAGRLARFEREARAVAALNHPNIVTLHSLEEEEGLRFLTMELVHGRTLDRLIPPGGFAVEALIGYALPLSEALAAAHKRGIVHRDLKPGNVMLTEDGRLKLLDFGLATIAAGSDAFAPLDRAGNLTREGLLVGTCRYMSPEQLQGRPLDCRSDVFALGVVLYELATGRTPFGGATVAEMCSAILREPPTAVYALRPDLPRALSDLIMRCLEKDPRRRFADAGEVHRALPALTRAAGAPPEEPAPAPTRGRAPVVLPPIDLPKPPSVAVLPFLNLSASPENEFFADGITEDVIAHLSKIRSLKVISRTSVMSFRKREQSLRDIAAALGTATILEGSVRRVGNRVRIVAQLIDAETDDHLWADTYDRDLTDIFAIQTDVALQIAAALRAELSPGEQVRIRRPPTHDLNAYQLYLQGRHCFRKYTAEGLRLGISYFEQAIAEDPEFAMAHVGLAQIYAELPNEGLLVATPAVAFGQAKEAIARALTLDDGLGDAHGIVALLRFVCDFDWAGAEAEFELALELSPGSADIYDYYGWMCSALERYDDAIRLAKRARELDPLAHRSDLATALLRAGRCQEARELGARVVEFDPGFSRGHSVSGWACLKLGRYAEGLLALERAVTLSPGSTMLLGQLGQAYALTGNVGQAREVLQKLHERARQGYVSPYHFAYVHTGLGEQDEAIDWLERAYEQRAGAVYGIKGSFLFTSLRSHPRFTALLKKMNLT
jgi:eukaryotic-like serine/threonine-protein kinase